MLALTSGCTHQAQLPAQSTALDTQAAWEQMDKGEKRMGTDLQ